MKIAFHLSRVLRQNQELTETLTDISSIDKVQQDAQTKNRIVKDVESYLKSDIGYYVVKVLWQN